MLTCRGLGVTGLSTKGGEAVCSRGSVLVFYHQNRVTTGSDLKHTFSACVQFFFFNKLINKSHGEINSELIKEDFQQIHEPRTVAVFHPCV